MQTGSVVNRTYVNSVFIFSSWSYHIYREKEKKTAGNDYTPCAEYTVCTAFNPVRFVYFRFVYTVIFVSTWFQCYSSVKWRRYSQLGHVSERHSPTSHVRRLEWPWAHLLFTWDRWLASSLTSPGHVRTCSLGPRNLWPLPYSVHRPHSLLHGQWRHQPPCWSASGTKVHHWLD